MRKSFPLKRTSFSWGFWPLLLLFFTLSFSNSHDLRKEGKDCPSSSCGPGLKITNPFRLKQYPQDCGRPEPEFELTCENNNTQALIHLPPRRYYVQEISYKHKKIRLLDPALAASSSFPLYNSSPSLNHSFGRWDFRKQRLVFVNCSQAVSEPSYVATAPCNYSPTGAHVYAMLGESTSVSQLNTSCRVVMNLPIILDGIGNLTSCSGIHDVLMRGFYVRWDNAYHFSVLDILLWAESIGAIVGAYYLQPRTIIGILCFLCILKTMLVAGYNK
ncbi:hypothetical protein MRB53_016284 [Persea americana]|uniref:Uncharacterized protein n=1 Tax=Persea americana TaxID=3435 RepID=A0ACC2M1S2_PERAE|nr:hypothetical protein MRB53_016284 [Persea americana]